MEGDSMDIPPQTLQYTSNLAHIDALLRKIPAPSSTKNSW